MLNIKRVWGENFCQFRKFDHSFAPGLTCILGMNGGGKSNLVRAIYLCLVGDFYGPSNLVRDGHNRGMVSMEAETPQGPIIIERKLKHNAKTRGTSISHSVTADWLQEPLTRKADVAAFLQPFIGVQASVLEYVAFALQGSFANLMLMDHTPRARLLNSLMGLERADALRGVLKDSMDLIADYPDRAVQIAAAEDMLRRVEEDRDKEAKAFEKAKANLTDKVKMAYKKALVIKSKPVSNDRDKLMQAIKEQEEELLEKISVQQSIVDKASEFEKVPTPDHEGASKHARYKRAKEAFDKLEKELEELEKTRPEEPSDEVKELTSTEYLVKLRTDDGRLTRLAKELEVFKSGQCPTCEQDVTGTEKLDQLKEEYEALAVDMKERHDKAHEAWTTMDTYARKTTELTTKKGDLMMKREGWKKELDECGAYADFDMEKYRHEVGLHTKYLEADMKGINARKALDPLKEKLEELRVGKAKLETADTCSQVQYDWACNMIKAHDDATQEHKEAESALSAAEHRVTYQRKTVETLKEDIEQSQVNRSTKELLAFARERLHPEFLPRIAAQGTAAAINRAMKKYLDMFDFPYGFRLDENLDFVVDFDTSTDHSAAILSGGESVRAAMAMRFGMLDVFGSGCGIIVLDEPTTGQDKDAENALVDVLGTAAAYFRKRNIKILCPTHALKLEAAADAVVTIGG